LISRASLSQRSGRAGRETNGTSFHLIPSEWFDNDAKVMTNRPENDLRKVNLSNVLLLVKKDIVISTMEPPDEGKVNQSYLFLKMLGFYNPSDEIGFLGYFCRNMGCDLNLGKLLAFSVFLKCVKFGCFCLAFESLGENIWNSKNIELFKKAKYMGGDLITYYYSFLQLKENCDISTSLKKYMNKIHAKVKSIIPLKNDCNKYCKDQNILQAVLTAGFYPNIGKFPDGKTYLNIMSNNSHTPSLKEVKTTIHPLSLVKVDSRTKYISFFKLERIGNKNWIKFCSESSIISILMFGELKINYSKGSVNVSGHEFLLTDETTCIIRNINQLVVSGESSFLTLEKYS
jgi:HrpA-like RNA helicase